MKTVAIFDDDVYIGNMIEEVLQAEGYAVVRAYSGTEALLLLKNSKPGCAVCLFLVNQISWRNFVSYQIFLIRMSLFGENVTYSACRTVTDVKTYREVAAMKYVFGAGGTVTFLRI